MTRPAALVVLLTTAATLAAPPVVRRPTTPVRPSPGASPYPATPAPTILPGDKVHLNIQLTDHTTFTGADCRDKVTVLFFWMSLERPLASAAQVNDLAAKYADRALQVIGINGDHKLESMTDSVAKLGLTFPQHWTGYWRENKVARDFGVPFVPYAAVIGPDATVLYVGTAARLEDEIDKAFTNHPPKLAAADDLLTARGKLGEIRTALSAKDALAAFRAYADIPAQTLKDPAISRPAGDLRSRLAHSTDEAFKQVEQLVRDNKNVDAALGLRAMVQTLGTLTGTSDAQRRLDTLLSSPDVKQEVQRADREQAANTALADARRMRDSGQDEAAYHRFKAVTMDYDGTPAAAEAAGALKTYDADPAFQRKLRETAAGPKALAALNLADNYVRTNRPTQARAKYQEILDTYPDTKYADQAKKSLADLPP